MDINQYMASEGRVVVVVEFAQDLAQVSMSEDRQRDRAGQKTEDRKREEQSAQPRSAGDHKFRKQGSAWVDEKFKSSMSDN